MKIKYLDSNINTLGINDKIIKILNDNDIILIKDLWNLERKDLKSFKLNNNEINDIIVHLQLKGLDLNKKMYS